MTRKFMPVHSFFGPFGLRFPLAVDTGQTGLVNIERIWPETQIYIAATFPW